MNGEEAAAVFADPPYNVPIRGHAQGRGRIKHPDFLVASGDPFLGSGTTLIAAEKVGRVCYGLEIDPSYVDVSVRRWQEYAKADAVLEGDGRTFDEVAAERLASAAAAGDDSPHGAGLSGAPREPVDRGMTMGKGRRPPPPTNYEVGYGRPPKSTRFKPGQSGNPEGRPRPQKTVAALLQKALSRKVMFHENGVTESLSVEELALKQLANKAAKGDLRALKLLFELKDRYHGRSGEQPFVIRLEPEDLNL